VPVTAIAVERPGATPDPDDAAVTRLRDRLVRPMPADALWSWVATLVITALAAVLRLVDLGRPNRIIFDETYYAKDSLSQTLFGYARKAVEDADSMVVDGRTDVFLSDPSFVVHPPVGKWVLGQGINLLGMSPAGWRLGTAIAGIVTVLLVCRIGRRLFRSTVLGMAAGLFVAVDGMSIAISRTAILDGILTTFIVAAFACLLVDRDRMRERYAQWVGQRLSDDAPLGDGPVLGWRPWRLAAGILLGLAIGTKWNGLYALAVFGLMTVIWDIAARRAAGLRSPTANALLRDGPVAFLTVVGSAAVTYLTSWWGWIASSDAWDRQWAADNPPSFLGQFVPDWLRSLWHYHDAMWQFHSGLESDHTYESGPWSWLYLGRPVAFDYQEVDTGVDGCDAAQCSQEVLALGNPVLWWLGLGALLVLLWWWLIRRDWRAGAILAGYVATWGIWAGLNALGWLTSLPLIGGIASALETSNRTTFIFYAVTVVPFIALAVAYCLGLLIGPATATPTRRAAGAVIAGGIVLAIVAVAWYFYPLHVDQILPEDVWRERMWFDSWI
jgi:dolichyl-phosphate-mannose-protein mannosyltransferase